MVRINGNATESQVGTLVGAGEVSQTVGTTKGTCLNNPEDTIVLNKETPIIDRKGTLETNVLLNNGENSTFIAEQIFLNFPSTFLIS